MKGMAQKIGFFFAVNTVLFGYLRTSESTILETKYPVMTGEVYKSEQKSHS